MHKRGGGRGSERKQWTTRRKTLAPELARSGVERKSFSLRAKGGARLDQGEIGNSTAPDRGARARGSNPYWVVAKVNEQVKAAHWTVQDGQLREIGKRGGFLLECRETETGPRKGMNFLNYRTPAMGGRVSHTISGKSFRKLSKKKSGERERVGRNQKLSLRIASRGARRRKSRRFRVRKRKRLAGVQAPDPKKKEGAEKMS